MSIEKLPNPIAEVITVLVGMIVMLLIGISLGGCKPQKVITERITVRDTVSRTVTVTLRDTILYTPEARADLKIPLKGIQTAFEKPLMKKDKQAVLTLKKEGDELLATCHCDSLEVAAQMKDTTIEELRSKSEQSHTTEKEKTPWGMKWGGWIAAACLAAITVMALRTKRA